MMEENFGRTRITPDPDCRRDRRTGRPHGTRRGAGAGHDSGVPDHLRPPGSSPTAPSEGPSTFQAGANPNAGSYSIFTYPNAAEDVKTAKTNFTAGLLGNPESVPKCPEANLQANTCPASTLIGTSRLDVKIAGTANPFKGFAGSCTTPSRWATSRAGSESCTFRGLGVLHPLLHHPARRGRLRPDRDPRQHRRARCREPRAAVRRPEPPGARAGVRAQRRDQQLRAQPHVMRAAHEHR